MSGNFEQRLQVLRSAIETARAEKAKAEAMLEMLHKRQAEIHAELATLGVKPEELNQTITALERELEAKLAEAESLVPAEFGGRPA